MKNAKATGTIIVVTAGLPIFDTLPILWRLALCLLLLVVSFWWGLLANVICTI
jgi:hypothetical protein